ncbi:MAG: type II toxin-antitoxin system Phd/YefM family antitoxin [Caldilineaceae bacterium]
MQVALEAVPITELKTGPNQIIEKIAEQPLMLTQHGRSVAVLVSPEQWNAIAKQLAERRFSRVEVEAIIEAYRKAAENRPTISMEEHKARMAARYEHIADKA